jgi:uncharacterized membrane protein
MFTRSALTDRDGLRFTLRPNGSLRWRAAKWSCAFVIALTAGVATWFTLRGAWLVLPFAGAEMVVLVTALYLSCRWSRRTEVLLVDADTIVFQRGRDRPLEEHRFQRAWARAVLVRDPKGWYPSRLLLRSHGRSVEVGSWLVEEERLELAEELARVTGSSTVEPTLPLPATSARTRSVTL